MNENSRIYKTDIKQSQSNMSMFCNGLLPPLNRGEQPPARTDIEPFPGEDVQHLEAILAHVLHETCSQNGYDLALALMRYVSGELVYGFKCGFTTGSEVFAAQPGITCAGFAKAFVALAKCAKIPAREAALHNLDNCIGHTVCELWVDGRWICMDPRYGLVFLSQEHWAPSALLSFAQLINHHDFWHPFKILQIPSQGRNRVTKSGHPESINPDSPDEQFYTRSMLDRYRNIVATAYPVTYRATATCFPLLADLRELAYCEWFALNSQARPNDRILGIGQNNGSRSLGYAFMNMLWLHSSGPARIQTDIRFTAAAPPVQCLPLAHLRVISQTRPFPEHIRLTFHTTADQAMALLVAPNAFGVLETVRVSLA